MTKKSLLDESSSANKTTSIASEGFSKLESRSLHIEEVLTNVQELLPSVVESNSSVANKSNIEGVLTSIEERLTARIDKTNSNAVKHINIANEAFSRLKTCTDQIKEMLATVEELPSLFETWRSNRQNQGDTCEGTKVPN